MKRFLWVAAAGLLVGVFLGSFAHGLNLSYGECRSLNLSDGVSSWTEEVCAPALSSDEVNLSWPAWGVSEKLDFICASGERVNAPVFPSINASLFLVGNSSNSDYVPLYGLFVSSFCNATVVENVSNESCGSGSNFTQADCNCQNATVLQYPIFNEDKLLDFGGEWFNASLNLRLRAPQFPRVNALWSLGNGEVRTNDSLGLMVVCNPNATVPAVNCSASVVNASTGLCENWTRENWRSVVSCSLSDVPQEFVSAACQARAGVGQSTGQVVQQQGTEGNADWIVIGIMAAALACGLYMIFNRGKKFGGSAEYVPRASASVNLPVEAGKK